MPKVRKSSNSKAKRNLSLDMDDSPSHFREDKGISKSSTLKLSTIALPTTQSTVNNSNRG